MLRRQPTEAEIVEYTKVKERKDSKAFDKYIMKLDNVQLLYLLQIILYEYSASDLSKILDEALELPLKEELGELWSFRSANGLGE